MGPSAISPGCGVSSWKGHAYPPNKTKFQGQEVELIVTESFDSPYISHFTSGWGARGGGVGRGFSARYCRRPIFIFEVAWAVAGRGDVSEIARSQEAGVLFAKLLCVRLRQAKDAIMSVLTPGSVANLKASDAFSEAVTLKASTTASLVPRRYSFTMEPMHSRIPCIVPCPCRCNSCRKE